MDTEFTEKVIKVENTGNILKLTHKQMDKKINTIFLTYQAGKTPEV